MTVWSKPQAFPDLNGVPGLLLRQKQVIYMGLVVSSEGLQGNPSKARAINNIPAPTDK